MESVAAERLNKLGKNPSIISTRHDLKRDAAVLKDIINRATPQPSTDESEEEDDQHQHLNKTNSLLRSSTSSSLSLMSSSSSSRSSKTSKSSSNPTNQIKVKGSLDNLNPQINNSNKKRRRKKVDQRKKSSSSEKKFQKLSRLFLAAPSPTLNLKSNQLKKSPSTPWSLFRKTHLPNPNTQNQPSS